MPKIQLGNPPKTIAHKCEFELVQGTRSDINVHFIYRTRSEFSEFIDGLYPRLKEGDASPAAGGVDVVELSAAGIAVDVRHILGCVKSWDLEEELNESNVRQLVDAYPAAAAALMADYRIAIVEGRAKN